MKVEGKKALVFGGTSGIGLAAACQLRDLGAEVVIISRVRRQSVTSRGAGSVCCP